jgi:hypothetical protein
MLPSFIGSIPYGMRRVTANMDGYPGPDTQGPEPMRAVAGMGSRANGAHLQSQRRKETEVSEHDAVKSEDGSGRVEELTLAAGAWRSTGFGAPRRRQGNLAQTQPFPPTGRLRWFAAVPS